MRALDALPRQDGGRFTPWCWEPRGLTAGPGSLMDAVLRAAGLDQRVERPAPGPGGSCCASRPICWSSRRRRSYPSLATDLFDHPALAGLRRRAIPAALTICAGPFTAQAAALLAQ